MTEKPSDADPQSEATSEPATREVSREPVTLTRNPSHWIAPIALVVALIGVALAAWTLFTAPAAPVANQQSGGDPKQRACSAFQTVTTAVRLQTHGDIGPEPAALEAVAANARLALTGGGLYLMSRIGPDTPQDLADALRSFANNLQDIGMSQLAGVRDDDPAQTNRLNDGQNMGSKIASLCQ